ncbi:MAG: HEAT repeat domain-containing protein [Coxiellaceae bacterium]|nr:MAG: HEAT repeat domain-containing protein [Coxiellaceae bacterium]
MAIAAELMNDSHYGVKLAVVQSLERMKTDDALNLLQNLAANNNERRIKTMAMRALERHKFGINSDKRIHTVLEKLQTQNLIRKNFKEARGMARSIFLE